MKNFCLVLMIVAGTVFIWCGIRTQSYMMGHPHDYIWNMMYDHVPWQLNVASCVCGVLYLIGLIGSRDQRKNPTQ